MAGTATKLPDERESVAEQSLDHDVGLYRHTKRPQWGAAILAWEKGGRRAYQFEDGRLRKFSEGYYSLMKPAEREHGSDEALIAELEAAIEANRGRGPIEALEPVCSFQDQVDLFKELYPEGFQGEAWVSDHRGSESGRDLKRHRDAAARAAQDQLSAERCAAALEEDRHGELVETALEILAGTSLVALKDVKALRGLDEDEGKRLAEAMVELLHGESDFGGRFKAWLATLKELLGGRPSWRLATVLPALLYPDQHVCVRHSAFHRQAASVAPRARYSKKPQRRAYANYRRVAKVVKKRLEAADLSPRDLLDVHDFIWATLRNAALEHVAD